MPAPDHDKLLSLLQDRKASTKGRASRRMAICLSADLTEDLEDANDALDAANQAVVDAEANADTRAGGKVRIDPELAKAVKAAEKTVEDAEAAADAASVFVTFKALRSDAYDELLKEHPPRDDNDLDKATDFNRDTFPDALMRKSAAKQVEDVDGKPVAMDVQDLITEMSSGERNVACQVSLEVNQRTSTFSEANSLNRRRSASSSKRR